MRRPRSLIARVEAMRDVAACLESFICHRGGPSEVGDYKLADAEVCNVAESIAALMADELEQLITEVNDDHIIIKPAQVERAKKKAGRGGQAVDGGP